MCFQSSCSLTYKSYSTGYHPFELMVEDYPTSPISLSYSDKTYTHKRPHALQRQKRQAPLNGTTPASTPTPRVYRNTIAPLSKLPLQFSIYGWLLRFCNGCSLKPVCLLVSNLSPPSRLQWTHLTRHHAWKVFTFLFSWRQLQFREWFFRPLSTTP